MYWNIYYVWSLFLPFQTVCEDENKGSEHDQSIGDKRKESLVLKAADTAGDDGQGPDLLQESSFSGNYSATFYQPQQAQTLSSRPYINYSPYDSEIFVANQLQQEDENAVWAKLAAMQLRKLPPYEAARLRHQIDALILKAIKPQWTVWNKYINKIGFLESILYCKNVIVWKKLLSIHDNEYYIRRYDGDKKFLKYLEGSNFIPLVFLFAQYLSKKERNIILFS